MPNSPSVNFLIKNLNVQPTVPVDGVTCMLARTTRGVFNDPSVLLTTYTQFKTLFGEEIVPDGTPSNIEKAFNLGSKLRIIRVPGLGIEQGKLVPTVESEDPDIPENTILSIKKNLDDPDMDLTVYLGFKTKTYDELIDGVPTFDVEFYRQGNTIWYSIYPTGKPSNVLETNPVLTFKNGYSTFNTIIDTNSILNFFNNSAYIEPVILKSTDSSVKTIEQLIKWLDGVNDTPNYLSVSINNLDFTTLANPTNVVSVPGSSGSAPTRQDWIDSLEYLRDCSEPYQIGCSHINQHLESEADILAVHKAAKQLVDELDEFVYFIEVPKYTTHYTQGTVVRDKASIINWAKICQNTIGYSKNVAYFAGGIKYGDDRGILVNSDILGTMVGLADYTASNFGAWKSFAGMNRGVIYDGNGPATHNYGAPSRYNDLNELANNYVNMIVVKDTASSGKQTMLWHCFSSQVIQDSFKFLSIVNLVHYLKKHIRPILENKIEEPNYIPTWRDIYFEVKPMLDDLVEQEAMSEYTWQGDQNATGYADMQVNNEADVRQGKYKAFLTFKDIVPMQDITMAITIDKASRNTNIEVVNQ